MAQMSTYIMPLQNRLHLNFDLQTFEDRKNFIAAYVQAPQFQEVPLLPSECETIGDYLMWGIEENGQTAAKNAGVKLESYWDKDQTESLEAILESPTFNEQSFKPLDTPKTIIRKETFSRQKAIAAAPEHLKPEFESLWREIDELEFKLNWYEWIHEKRKEPPRPQLQNRISEDTRQILSQQAAALAPYHYLKLKRQLVTLRQQQFILKDSYTSVILPRAEQYWTEPAANLTFGDEINVYPLGLKDERSEANLLFREEIYTEEYTDQELWAITRELERLKKKKENPLCDMWIDFRDVNHLKMICDMGRELWEEENSDSTKAKYLWDTFEYYTLRAALDPMNLDILKMKLTRKDNGTIREYVNKKYSKNYNSNYISTLYCQKILPQIAAAAVEHEEEIQNVFFKEEFKQCIDCGKHFLLRDKNFVKRKRSKDGYSPRCKRCEKILREKNK